MLVAVVVLVVGETGVRRQVARAAPAAGQLPPLTWDEAKRALSRFEWQDGDESYQAGSKARGCYRTSAVSFSCRLIGFEAISALDNTWDYTIWRWPEDRVAAERTASGVEATQQGLALRMYRLGVRLEVARKQSGATLRLRAHVAQPGRAKVDWVVYWPKHRRVLKFREQRTFAAADTWRLSVALPAHARRAMRKRPLHATATLTFAAPAVLGDASVHSFAGPVRLDNR